MSLARYNSNPIIIYLTDIASNWIIYLRCTVKKSTPHFWKFWYQKSFQAKHDRYTIYFHRTPSITALSCDWAPKRFDIYAFFTIIDLNFRFDNVVHLAFRFRSEASLRRTDKSLILEGLVLFFLVAWTVTIVNNSDFRYSTECSRGRKRGDILVTMPAFEETFVYAQTIDFHFKLLPHLLCYIICKAIRP